MRKEIDKTFNVFDSTISIWQLQAEPSDWETYEAIRMMLVRYGFSFHQDPIVKKSYRRLANMHHCGNRQDVFFASSITGRRTQFEFYEDVKRDNQNGGRYHFDKLAKMPYLRRLKTLLAIRRVTDLLSSLGFTESDRNQYPKDALAAVMKRRRELEDFQGPDFYTREQYSYNTTDADGTVMKDGDVRCFWDRNGRLLRGVVYRNINNMWWVVCNRFHYTNVANFNLFTWRPEMGRKREVPALVKRNRLAAELDRSLKSSDYVAVQRLAKCLASIPHVSSGEVLHG